VSSVGGNGFGTRLFWTTAIPDDDVEVHFAAGKAELHVTNLALKDYPKIPIALGPQWRTAFVPATISFDVVWNRPVTRRVTVHDGNNGDRFAGEFLENDATVTWSARNADGFRFTANPGNLSTSIPGGAFVELGHERNGRFVGDGEGEGDDGHGGSSPALASGSDGGGRDAVFAALALLGDNWALHPTSAAMAPGATDLALRGSWDDPLGGPGQMLLTSGSQNGLARDLTGQDAPLVRAAGDGAFAFAPDLAATSLATETGLPGEDILIR
jgi:hypothetical protein